MGNHLSQYGPTLSSPLIIQRLLWLLIMTASDIDIQVLHIDLL